AIYVAYLALFTAANLAVSTANRVFMCHSVPGAKHLDAFDTTALERDELNPRDLVLGGTIHWLVWGRDVREAHVEAFLKKVDANFLITGHIPCEQGYIRPNERQITLNALGTPARYCLFPTNWY